MRQTKITHIVMKTVLTYIILLLAFFNSDAQETSEALITKFNTYQKATLNEKIFIHTDRTFYLTGETIWLKLYCREASFLTPLDISKVAYIELIGADQNSAVQMKLSLEKGNGSGSIFLPSSLTSGHYILRAYTNWMRNFDASGFFEQPLMIINPFTKLPPTSAKKKTTYDVQFFPEGGHLVNGLKSTVGFRAVNSQGKGIDFRGAVLNENGDTIVSFIPYKFGVGRFDFTPSKEHRYRVAMKTTDESLLYTLPDIADKGFVMTVKDTLAEKIAILVKATLDGSLENPTLHLLIHAGKKNVFVKSSFLQNEKALFVIDKKQLEQGASHFTLFDASLHPVCDRLYYKEVKEQLKISVLSQQRQYLPRKKATLTVSTTFNNSPVSADMSVSVFKIDSLQGQNKIDIASYLLLTSELKGTIESPEYYFQNHDDTKQKALDNLMLTHGWNRFNWAGAVDGKFSRSFTPENGGHILKAKVSNIQTGAAASKIATFLSTPGKVVKLYVSRTNEDGIATFELKDFYDDNEILIQTNTQIDSIYKFEILTPFSQYKSSYSFPSFSPSENLKNDLEQRSIHMQVHSIFYQNELRKKVNKTIDSSAFYGTPDARYQLDDYTRFPTMEEVMREYVPGVAVRKRKDGFHFMNYDAVHKLFFKENPLILIDGIPVFDVDKIMMIDPRKIKSLDVMTRRYYLGPSSFDGLVSYTTYNGNMAGFSPDTRSLIRNYQGAQLQQEFFSPVYDLQKSASTLPDTRTLLYWSPTTVSDTQGKSLIEFYTSDISGTYQIVVQGITDNGNPGSETATFQIKEKLDF